MVVFTVPPNYLNKIGVVSNTYSFLSKTYFDEKMIEDKFYKVRLS